MRQNHIHRRNFIRQSSLTITGLLGFSAWKKAFSVPFVTPGPLHNIPADKGLDPRWVKSLYATGKVTTYRKSRNELKYIGMPSGGLHTGTLYMGGDGRLWLWGIYNDDREGIDTRDIQWYNGQKEVLLHPRDGANYVEPPAADNKRWLEQGFAVKINYNGKVIVKELKEDDWDEIVFEATYPLATVTYTDKHLPVEIVLKGGAFYIPMDAEDSALPATFFHIEIKNHSGQNIEAKLTGWQENGAHKLTAAAGDGARLNTFIGQEHSQSVFYTFRATREDASLQRDAGTMSFGLIGKQGSVNTAANPYPVDSDFFESGSQQAAEADAPGKLTGSLTVSAPIPTGGSFAADYALAWHFNHPLKKLAEKMPESKAGYHYAARFKDAAAVMEYISANYNTLRTRTFLWQKTYYDSTLPHWLLERAIINIGTIATANTYRFASGRFWGWEGVNSCEGTCTHVWQYGHALARIFPSLERDTRQRVDLGVGMQENGGILFRGEFANRPAIDGQAGTILRIYREHQMSADNSFLQLNWKQIRKAVLFMLAQDKNGDGMTDTPMENTLDAIWEGEIAWIVGLCIAAAKAGQLMAEEMNDEALAATCRQYVEKGNRNMASALFNGEYFIHRPDAVAGKKKLGSYNTCHIDQVYGQSWAFQVGLGRLWDKEKTLSALRSLWKYNFTPDVGPYIQTHIGGRPYALAGEAGMIMNTNPHNEQHPYGEDVTWQTGYFHECMSGFEHQVAAHMMAEGMTDEALVLTRAIHDRYHAAKRNPYNEIECSDHYARAMASYGTFIAACGLDYHGPKGHIGFDPKLSPDDFRAPFTTAEGWGGYAQQRENGSLKAQFTVHHGRLRVKTAAFVCKGTLKADKVEVRLGTAAIGARLTHTGKDALLVFEKDLIIEEGNKLAIIIG